MATVDLKFPIKLDDLNMRHQQFSSYEPELYPGLIYRMVSPRIVLLIFVNGKVVLTGDFLFFFLFLFERQVKLYRIFKMILLLQVPKNVKN